MSTSNINNIPILLTSSVVAHDKEVRLQDPTERARLAMESVQQWRAIAPHNPLVLCDGSGFDFQPMVAKLVSNGPVECLHFQNNVELVQKHGRGFGEGEIVRHAVEHSTLIKSAGCFAKCTSKLWVENFSTCMQSWNGLLLMKGVFDHVFTPRKTTTLAYIDTRFYAMDVRTYQQHFQQAHELIRVQEGYGLEESFRDIFLSKQLKHCLMSPPPVISGVGGGTGAYYKNTKLRQLKEKWRYQLVKCNPLFRNWFA
ncbi:hypothetical protein AEP_00499 [Curvibacter sp. AEP1-3]|uniref:hypothetical protein n=1 Tax=Curvibacter sp. AEP1-3 TaxID=1844971 RepID=UPI000B3C597B|nr:hypothetical protein [Curvibacter sp. AEP1-3]ARV17459.1 hypothetical protein AEP_00499 [Curvibacter sp. AEP1-3]